MNNKWILTGLLLVTPLLAQASCESVKAQISQKIINNGVPESGFTLEIVPNDQADDQTDGLVVGHCENDSQKIIYRRNSSENDTRVPANAGTSQDSPTP
ncbi:hypothetical protein BL250_04205 [Erwinia sp. OLTSP20]|uniref:DUF1161 domain-containing protein n=1 Tax=unclassified Erwinia TaxID=2622719 RepID=UPI000C6C1175|nr:MULTISPECIES: DUF1161 domain-containing protein [unclassified Erwinia]PIJ51700.1 hypothetical protein BV501_03135 [Erwinia sp. OAMSP11]PIJ75587.1 hypothetical protein BK416_01430 [Erwinia sp. OLSSP12]PIJ84892.1 hypothetical protein BLD47_01360 [Erwinia sp. OLCASP19]PIJ86671.1 hypothetical protein BLD46_02960 [Erwinia sp. OLMTSP26]PIJ88112.1 hypothetical protein BLD49_03640 [Erwinia sp. OLMDSP33]